jgi:hypothetical protein
MDLPKIKVRETGCTCARPFSAQHWTVIPCRVAMYLSGLHQRSRTPAQVPLILGIWGGKGQGKTFQVRPCAPTGGVPRGTSPEKAPCVGSWQGEALPAVQPCVNQLRPRVARVQCALAYKKLGISPIVMSAGERAGLRNAWLAGWGGTWLPWLPWRLGRALLRPEPCLSLRRLCRGSPAGELESGNAGEPAKLIRQRYREVRRRGGDWLARGEGHGLQRSQLHAACAHGS